jgi:hypothetical protein
MSLSPRNVFLFALFLSVSLASVALSVSPIEATPISISKSMSPALMRVLARYENAPSRDDSKPADSTAPRFDTTIRKESSFANDFAVSRDAALSSEVEEKRLRAAREKAASDACLSNRQAIYRAVQEWARMNPSSPLVLPTLPELIRLGYLGELPMCPMAGEYWVSRPAEAPSDASSKNGFWVSCSIHSHSGNLRP